MKGKIFMSAETFVIALVSLVIVIGSCLALCFAGRNGNEGK